MKKEVNDLYNQAENLRYKDLDELISCLQILLADNEEMPICELCDIDWHDETLYIDELRADRESIENNKRCIGCYEEWGDTYPDR
jgi:hypothetical protein